MNGSGVPEISVLIPCYNYGRYVGRAIRSVLDQNVPGLEVVVVDDVSTDNTWDVISAIAAADTRVRAYRNEKNLGLRGNPIRLLELARSNWVSFLSADDYQLPGHLQRLLTAHREHPDIDYVFTSYFRVDDNERIIDYVGHIGHLRGDYFGGRNEFAGLLTYDCYTNMATSLFDREEILRVGLDLEFAASDYHLYLRLARAGKRFAFINVPGVCFRAHGEGISHEGKYAATGRQLLEQIIILERHLLPENHALLSGHERGIASLVQAKINNLQRYPDVAATVLPELKPRIDAVVAQLNGFLRITDESKLPALPRISILLPFAENINAAAETIASIQAQTYANYEIVMISDASFATMPFLLDAARGSDVKPITHTSPQSLAVAMNDGVRMATGEIVTYVEPGVIWPVDHLERVVARFLNEGIEALVVPLSDGGAIAGSPLAEQFAVISEGVPLIALAHLRRIVDRVGLFQENLPHLADAEFVFRVMSRTRIGVDPNSPITRTREPSWLHPALRDAQGYLSSLRAIYQAYPTDEPLTSLREAHFARVSRELQLVTQAPGAGSRTFADIMRGIGND